MSFDPDDATAIRGPFGPDGILLPKGKCGEKKMRELVKPLFLAMFDLGMDRVVIERKGTECSLTIFPSKPEEQPR